MKTTQEKPVSHTPGPWAFEWLSQAEAPKQHKDEPDVWPILIYRNDGGSGQGSHVAEIPHEKDLDPNDTHSDESFANAALLAAAPELLGGLIEATDYMARLNPKHEESSTVQRLRAIIAKATGATR